MNWQEKPTCFETPMNTYERHIRISLHF